MTKYSVKKPFTVFVAVVLLLVLGVVSFTKMTTDLLPHMNLPYVIVATTYPGASPEKVEKDISEPLEAALGTVNGVKKVQSVSNENYSMVVLEFEDDMNMDSAMVKLSTAINELELPESAGKSSIMEISPDLMATMYVSVDYDGKDIYELSDFCEKTVIPYFERQAGVASVEATGLVDKTVRVELNEEKIEQVNAKVLGIATEKLDEAQDKLDDAQSELNQKKNEISGKQKQLKDEQEKTSSELADLSKQLDEAIAAKTSFGTQQKGLEASKAALEMEQKAYKDNKVEKNLKQIEKGIETARSAMSGVDAYNMVYAQVYSQALIQATQQAVTAAGMDVVVSAENVDSVLTTLGSAADTIKAGAASAAEKIAKEQIQKQLDSIPLNVKDAIDHPEKLKALQDLMKLQGQGEAAKNLTKENLETLYNIVNVRMPQIEAELANLEVEIKAAEAVVKQVDEKMKEAEDGYVELEKGKLTAAATFGAFNAQLSMGAAQFEQGQSQIDSNQEMLDEQRASVLDSANLDTLLNKEMLSQILSAENFSMPAGTIHEGKDSYMVKIGEEYDSVDALRDTVICHMDKLGDVKLSDVADVIVTDNADDSYARMDDNDAIMLAISKASTSGTSEVSKACKAAIEDITGQHEGLHVIPIMDQGDYIKLIVDNVLSNLVWGALLAIIVLALFLKDVKPTIVVAFSIPLSVLFAIVLMYFSDITLNIISLSGLALGVGMLVDNSIVVIENIYRLRNEGMPAAKAAVKGAGQVAGAIFASTLTTICVFLPIVFASGLVKQLFVDMGLTIAYSLLASLVVALTLVPTMSATLLKNTKEKQHKWFDATLNAYEKILRFCLRFKAVPLLIAVGLLAFCIWQVTRIGMIFIPEMGGNQMTVTFNAPEEMEVTEGYELADQVIDYIKGMEGVETVGAMSGGGGGSVLLSGGTNKNFSFFILLDDKASKDNKVVAKKIEDFFASLKIEELTYSVSTSNMDMSAVLGSGLEIMISGQEIDELLRISEDVMALVSDVNGFEEVSNGQEDGNDEIRIIIDKRKAMQYNLTVAQVFQTIAAKLSTDKTATSLNVTDADYEVVISDKTKELTKDNIMQFELETTVKDSDGKEKKEKHKLSEIARMEMGVSLSSIRRENQSRYITVTASAKEGYNTTLLAREVEKKLAGYDVPKNYLVEIKGESQSVMDAMKDLLLMILLAVVFIYLIMVAQFQSLLSPFIVLFTIPLAFTGGFLALLLAGMELSVVSMMGFLVLSGVVVNNGIVFVDYVNQLRAEGAEKRDALVETGKTRMRPILMTAMTTILAMSTMAFSTNAAAAMGKGMALVTIGGLAYATLMTLFIVPVLYELLYRKDVLVVDIGDDL